jgi:hypothetical protein
MAQVQLNQRKLMNRCKTLVTSKFEASLSLVFYKVPLVGIAAVVLLFTGRVSEGMMTAAGGGFYGNAIACCWKLVKDTNDRLDDALRVLEDES